MKKAKYPNFIFIRGNHANPDTEEEPEEEIPGEGVPGEPGGDNGQNKPPPP